MDYDPGLWNNVSTITNSTNCYAYALNNQVHPDAGKSWFDTQQPGEYYNDYCGEEEKYDTESYRTDYTKVAPAVDLDYYMYNIMFDTSLVFEEVDRLEQCPAGSYKVALVFDQNDLCDYHWYRQDANGYWSHKLGGNPATNVDGSGDLILDPEIANHHYADDVDYSIFVAYFAVSPWNHMASASE